MKYEKLRIIEVGTTANGVEDDGEVYQIVISPDCLDSVVACGNSRKIHCRKTHNGRDLLDGFLGYFDNFSHDGNCVYADLTISEAVIKAYPNEVELIDGLIQNEPDMLGVSVNMYDDKVLDKETLTATVVKCNELYTCDLVGLPAATSSLFNNNSSTKMSKILSKFSSLFAKKKTCLATETFTTVDGVEITINAKGENADVGDEVVDSDGNPVADGEYEIVTDEGNIIIVVAGGLIAEVKAPMEEVEVEGTPTPEEFAALQAENTALKTENANLKTQLSKRTPAPNVGKPAPKTDPKVEEPDKWDTTKLNREEVAKAAAQFRNKKK